LILVFFLISLVFPKTSFLPIITKNSSYNIPFNYTWHASFINFMNKNKKLKAAVFFNGVEFEKMENYPEIVSEYAKLFKEGRIEFICGAYSNFYFIKEFSPLWHDEIKISKGIINHLNFPVISFYLGENFDSPIFEELKNSNFKSVFINGKLIPENAYYQVTLFNGMFLFPYMDKENFEEKVVKIEEKIDSPVVIINLKDDFFALRDILKNLLGKNFILPSEVLKRKLPFFTEVNYIEGNSIKEKDLFFQLFSSEIYFFKDNITRKLLRVFDVRFLNKDNWKLKEFYLEKIGDFYGAKKGLIELENFFLLKNNIMRVYLDKEKYSFVSFLIKGKEVISSFNNKSYDFFYKKVFVPAGIKKIVKEDLVNLKLSQDKFLKTIIFPLNEKFMKVFYKDLSRNKKTVFSFSLNFNRDDKKEIAFRNKNFFWKGKFPDNYYASYIDLNEFYYENLKLKFLNEKPDFLIFSTSANTSKIEFVYLPFIKKSKNYAWGVKFEESSIPDDNGLPVRQNLPVKIDGWLNDKIWQDAEHIIDLQRDSYKGDITDVYYIKKNEYIYIFIEGNFLDTDILLLKEGSNLCDFISPSKRISAGYIIRKGFPAEKMLNKNGLWLKEPYPRSVFSFSQAGLEIMFPFEEIKEGNYTVITIYKNKIQDETRIFPIN